MGLLVAVVNWRRDILEAFVAGLVQAAAALSVVAGAVLMTWVIGALLGWWP